MTMQDFPHILVVDDDSRLRSLLRKYLMESDFRVTVADGAEAATTLNAAAVDALIEDSRRAQTADEEQMRLLAAQNQLLAEQVSQMQKMLAQPTVAPITRSGRGAPAIGDAADVANVIEVIGRQ